MQRTFRRKILSVFLILAMLVSLMTGLAVNVSADEIDETEPAEVVAAAQGDEAEEPAEADADGREEDDGEEVLLPRDPDEFPEGDRGGTKTTLSGSGTANDPYLVGNQTELAAVNNDLAACYKLTANITLNSSWAGIGTSSISSASTYSPYETSSATGFTGTLDGDGHTITVSRTVTASGMGGVVNYLAPGGTVKNLAVSGTVTATGNRDAIGGVVGYNSGTIKNVSSSVTVSATSSYNVGGIAGFNNGYYSTSGGAASGLTTAIQNCANTGAVTGYAKVGGITGENSASISSCYNTGAIKGTYNSSNGVGGIAGRNGNNNTAVETGTIANCYNRGNISSGTAGNTSSQGRWVGGITGFQNSLSTCTNCYNTGNLVGYSYRDHTAGKNEHLPNSAGVVNCYGLSSATGPQGYDGTQALSANQMTSVSFVSSLAGSTSNLWAQSIGEYPVLVSAGLSTSVVVLTAYPTTLTYYAGESLNTAGMNLVEATLTGTTPLTGYSINPDPLPLGTTSVTISGTTASGISYSFSIPVTVNEALTVNIVKASDPTTLVYTAGDSFSTAGMVINAVYSSGTVVAITDYTVTANNPLTTNDTSVTISGTYVDTPNNISVSYSFVINITVNPAVNFVMVSYPTTLTYAVGATFDPTGMVIHAVAPGGSTTQVTSYTITPSGPLTLSDTSVTVSGMYSYSAFSFTINITVFDPALATVYLDVLYGDDATAQLNDASHPYGTLDAAVAAAGNAGTVYIMRTVELDGTTARNDNVTFKRHLATLATDPLFKIVGGTNTQTMSTMTIDGEGAGTLIEANGNTVNLRGDITLQNCAVAVDVKADSGVEINRASITATSYSVKTKNASSTFLLYNYTGASTSITGTVYLGEGSFIAAGAALPCNLAVELGVAWSTAKLVVGSGYTVTETDKNHVSCTASGWNVERVSGLNAVIVHDDTGNSVYLKNGNGTGGTGTYADPFLNIDDAAHAAGTTKPIYVLDTVTLGANFTFSGKLRRATTCGASMLVIPSGYTLTITGNNTQLDGGMSNGVTDLSSSSTVGTSLIYVNGGTLILTDGNLVNTKSGAGTVHVHSGTFKMNGGSIGTSSATRGGGVYVDGGTFELHGGSVKKNYGGSGGGVCVNSGTFVMDGGSIGENSASSGGGIYLAAGSATMSGGEIKNNSAVVGGGVEIDGSASFTMSGTAQLYGNTASSRGAGVYVTAGTTFNLGCSGIASTDTVYLANSYGSSDAYITLIGTLSTPLTIDCAYPALGNMVVYTNVNYIGSALTYITYYGGSYNTTYYTPDNVYYYVLLA